MLFDIQNKFSDSQDIHTATTISANVIDLGVAGRDLGVGTTLYVVLDLTTAITNTGTVTVTVEADSAVGLDATPTVLGTLPVLTSTNGTLGARFIFPLPPGVAATDQYLGLRYTKNAPVDTGAADAFLTDNPQEEKTYPDNITIKYSA